MAEYLIDKSAWARLPVPAVAERLDPLIAAGQVGMVGIIQMEILYSARTSKDFQAILEETESFERVETRDQDLRRAVDIMRELAVQNKHRSASIPDVVIAAVAERANLTVLHYDGDYDHIASVSNLRAEWVVKRGSIPD